MKTNFFLVIYLLVAGLLLAACSSTAQQTGSSTVGKTIKTDKGQFAQITVGELQTMLKNKDFTFVNVHVPFEGKIDPTDAFIPYDQIDQHLGQLPADKNAKIVLYCRSGRMSAIAANTLANLGYTRVFDLSGGFNAWKQAGLPLNPNQ
jgi:rhodanese-related sulfurtransferase